MNTIKQYVERIRPISEWHTINGLKIHVRHWSRVDKPKLLLLHGWMDASASFQFVVDALADDWDIYAMDWRGMGESEAISDGYYERAMMLSDLDKLVKIISPTEPLAILGHSLGGMLLSIYAGTRPEKVSACIIVEGFGMSDENETQQIDRMHHFFEALSKQDYFSRPKNKDNYIKKLRLDNPLLSMDKALYLAEFLLKKQQDDLTLSANMRHRISQPYPFNLNFFKKFWHNIKCPLLWVQGGFLAHNQYLNGIKDSLEKRYQEMGEPERIIIDNSGHMIHWEQPQILADVIQSFLSKKLLNENTR